MDPTAVKDLVIKYINCIKLLLSDTVPLPHVFDDLIQHTMVFSDQVKCHQANHKSNIRTENVTQPMTLQSLNEDDEDSVVQEPIVTRRQSTMTNDLKDSDSELEKSERQHIVMAKRLSIDKRIHSKETGVEIERTGNQPVVTEVELNRAKRQPLAMIKRLSIDYSIETVVEIEKTKVQPVLTEAELKSAKWQPVVVIKRQPVVTEAELKSAKWQPVVVIKRSKIEILKDDGTTLEKTKIHPHAMLRQFKMDNKNDSKVSVALPKGSKRQRGRPKVNHLKDVQVKVKRMKRYQLSESPSSPRNEDIILSDY